MYSIGILTREPIWEDKLSAFVGDNDFRISGTFWADSPEMMVRSPLFQDSDILWIPVFEDGVMSCAKQAVKLSHHLSLGFPVSSFPDQACELLELAKESRVQIQVGHHEHFNPAFSTMRNYVQQPQYIDLNHHIGLCNGEYWSKLFHALLTDIDLCLSLVPDTLKKFQSHAAYIRDNFPPILSARIEFNNGTVASIRIDPYKSDYSIKIGVYQLQNILRADLKAGTASIENFINTNVAGPGEIRDLWPTNGLPSVKFDENDPDLITGGCISFIHGLARDKHSVSSLDRGYEALKITKGIFDRISIKAG